jgi:HEPN domain-containing protein
MRESPRNEGYRWLEQAQVDLQWARHLQAEGAYYLVCFLAQQLAEKALKAFLYAQGEELVIGHSVRQLCQRAAAYVPPLLDALDDWSILDSYDIPTRYPNGLPAGYPGACLQLCRGKVGIGAGRSRVRSHGHVVYGHACL